MAKIKKRGTGHDCLFLAILPSKGI
jgi:hypothetical protein